jgi:hypothetical protein
MLGPILCGALCGFVLNLIPLYGLRERDIMHVPDHRTDIAMLRTLTTMILAMLALFPLGAICWLSACVMAALINIYVWLDQDPNLPDWFARIFRRRKQ